MKILITGANGLLGQKLVYKLRNRKGIDCIATARGQNRLLETSGYQFHSLDITNIEEVEALFRKVRPEIVINTAAMTNVDICETERDACWELNVKAVEYQVKTLELLQAEDRNYSPHFIHLSTDFIFDGTFGPLAEDAIPNPLSHYAKSKLASEKIVQDANLKSTIVRTVLVYGIVDNMSRSNFVLWVKSNLEAGKAINVVQDQYRTPTFADDLADGCILIAEKGATGVFHISGPDFMSIYDFALIVAEHFGLDKSLINASKTSDIKHIAERPLITGFEIDKAKSVLDYKPHSFKDGIALMDIKG